LKLHLVQMRPEPGDNNANLARIEEFVARGLAQGADLIAFGECALNGYDLRGKVDYPSLAETIPGPATVRIVKLLAGSRTLVLPGMAERAGSDLYNSAPLIGADGIIGVARKLYPMHLTTKSGRSYNEKLVFRPGQRIAIFDTEFGRIGVQICMDNVHPEISYAQSIAGCWLRLRPSAGPYRSGQPDVSKLDLARAVENQTCDCYVNIVGDQGGIRYRGGTSVILGGRGLQRQLSVGGDATEEVLEYEISPEDVRAARGGWRHIDEVRPDLLKQLWEISRQRESGKAEESD
jgi:predicted amidohydrolase